MLPAVLWLGLWLDLRGTSCGSGMSALLELYGGVRSRFERAGLPPPAGAAVEGVLHTSADLVGEENDASDGMLSLLAVEDGALWVDGGRAGAALSADGSHALPELRAAALAAVRAPERNLLLLGDDAESVRKLFEFALSTAEHCHGISGSQTRLLCACDDAQTLEAVRGLARDSAVPCAAVLPAEPRLWFDALSQP